jgi:hypothetical protein
METRYFSRSRVFFPAVVLLVWVNSTIDRSCPATAAKEMLAGSGDAARSRQRR